MWTSARVLIRLTFVVAVMLTAVALVLGRSSAAPAERLRPAPVPYSLVNEHLWRAGASGVVLVDAESGVTERVAAPSTEGFQYGSWSPWRDRRGKAQVVGLWAGATRAELNGAIGLVRYAVPGWEIVDRVETNIVPSSPPCWFPDATARIVFSAWDGNLYRFSFEPSPDDLDGSEQPRPLVWTTPRPAGLAMISNPTWPTDPRWKGKILASVVLAVWDRFASQPRLIATLSQIWWFQLNGDGTTIRGAGPLIRRGGAGLSEQRPLEDRPASAVTSDGRVVLAYLAREEPESGYRLRLAPVAFEGASGTPIVEAADEVEVSCGLLPWRPAFSPDGHWLHVISALEPQPIRLERHSVLDALASRRSLLVEASRATPSPSSVLACVSAAAVERAAAEPSGE